MQKLLKPMNFTVGLVIMVIMLMTYNKVNLFDTLTYTLAGIIYLSSAGFAAYQASDGFLRKYVKRTDNKASTMIMLVVYVMLIQMMFTNMTAMPLLHFVIYGFLYGIAVNLDAQYIKRKQENK